MFKIAYLLFLIRKDLTLIAGGMAKQMTCNIRRTFKMMTVATPYGRTDKQKEPKRTNRTESIHSLFLNSEEKLLFKVHKYWRLLITMC